MPQQNKKKLSTKQKMTIANVFRKLLHRLIKLQFEQIKPQSRLRNPRIDYSPFSHLQSLTQRIPADQIEHSLFSVPPQSIPSPMMIPHLNPVSQQMKWNSSISTFQYELVPLPASVRKCYGCNQSFTGCYRHYPKNILIRHRD